MDSTIIGSLHRLCFAYRAIDLDSAKMYGRQAITYAKESSDKSMEALGYAELAHAFYDSRDFDSALVIYERSNELFGELSMDEDVALNFSNIGRILLKQGKWDEALKSHQKALELLDTASVHVPYINWNIGKTLMTMGKYDEGVEAMKKTISRGDELLAGYARFSIAFSHTLSGDFITAIDHFFKCIEAFKNNKDFEALAQAEFNLGAAYIEIGAFDLGLEYFGKAEEYYRNANHATGLSYVLHGIGVVYAKQNNDEKSLEYLKRSEELKKNGGDHEEIISIKLDIISLLSKQKKAIEVYDIISEIDSSLKLSWDPRSKAKKDLRLGELHFHMGDFNKAKAAYDKALAFQKSEGMQPWAYHTYLNQGVLYDTLGQYEKAIKAFTNAVEIAKQTHSIAEEIEGLQYLYQQYDKTGNVVKSHKYLRRYMMLRDSISSFIKERHIIEMQTKFETTIKEKENEKITAENLVLTKEKKISDYQRIAALSGAAVLSCITLLLFLNFRNKKRVL
ncbi:MAG: tetratricopeptide repeat protein, partial [Flavobacteriales bacterium]|nr:tetratricopeptide repeat protein [Flavobacteriales bacterium]